MLRTTKPFRALGIDGITNGFLRAMGPKLVEAVAMLATRCWKLGHYPHSLKRARTITLRKLGKPLYSNLGAWRPIALLNTIGKIIETLVARRLSKAVEEHHLLLDT